MMKFVLILCAVLSVSAVSANTSSTEWSYSERGNFASVTLGSVVIGVSGHNDEFFMIMPTNMEECIGRDNEVLSTDTHYFNDTRVRMEFRCMTDGMTKISPLTRDSTLKVLAEFYTNSKVEFSLPNGGKFVISAVGFNKALKRLK